MDFGRSGQWRDANPGKMNNTIHASNKIMSGAISKSRVHGKCSGRSVTEAAQSVATLFGSVCARSVRFPPAIILTCADVTAYSELIPYISVFCTFTESFYSLCIACRKTQLNPTSACGCSTQRLSQITKYEFQN